MFRIVMVVVVVVVVVVIIVGGRGKRRRRCRSIGDGLNFKDGGRFGQSSLIGSRFGGDEFG